MASDTTSAPQNISSNVQVASSAPGSQSNLHISSVAQPEAFAFYPPREDSAESHPHQNGQPTEPVNNGAPLPYPPMPVFPYGNMVPPSPGMHRPKRTQCKNACINCQKACKKCDDQRPCQRCIRYGTTDTCIDSKRKERKKGIKRGPYKKRDGKGLDTVDADNGETIRVPQAVQGGTPKIPYVGPVGYPPALWSTYTPTGHGGKLEATGFYQPVFALTSVGGPPPHGGEGGSASGGNESPHFPVSFYPATFISYPGPFPPYPVPQGPPGSIPQGFHFAYPPPLFAHRPPQMTNTNSEQNGSGKDKDSDSQVNGQVKAQGNGEPAGKDIDRTP
ncbi:hypothetical protein M422DRAFT_34982 [Sphaerobolus stellatus SS14]|uniref:Transcription activator of gluconeogenesis ERT1 n=1 Tax=Sphaerobolus stellatus (strain SS14) TaxID=990650 RepID=A0A0C9TW81_SPHS4|nr:hypothetical protein M422DRAFT_34982 [Sphaerobolus stellatus SS14]